MPSQAFGRASNVITADMVVPWLTAYMVYNMHDIFYWALEPALTNKKGVFVDYLNFYGSY